MNRIEKYFFIEEHQKNQKTKGVICYTLRTYEKYFTCLFLFLRPSGFAT